MDVRINIKKVKLKVITFDKNKKIMKRKKSFSKIYENTLSSGKRYFILKLELN
jgi:hypothetical protein